MLNVPEVFSRKLSFTIFSEKRCNLIIFISVFTKVFTLGRRRLCGGLFSKKMILLSLVFQYVK